MTDSCSLCASLKTLPKEIVSANVIKKDGQLIFLCREKLPQLTYTCFIPDETANNLRESIVIALLELLPDSGTKVQVYCAKGFQNPFLIQMFKMKPTIKRVPVTILG